METNGNSPYGGRYALTRHARQRLNERTLTLTDLRAVLSVGRDRMPFDGALDFNVRIHNLDPPYTP